MIIGLQGELGSGKTFFAQKLGEVMGVKEHIVSPTFVIMKIYDIDWRGFKKFVHIDAYRLESESELLSLDWQDLIRDTENFILIEWPEKVAGLMPKDSKIIHFKHG